MITKTQKYKNTKIQKYKNRSKRPLKDLFRKFDTNDDGKIDYNEFYKTLHDMQCPLTKDEMEKVALFMDQDNDGIIDINGTCKFFS